jgi:hypothetical protein
MSKLMNLLLMHGSRVEIGHVALVINVTVQ